MPKATKTHTLKLAPQPARTAEEIIKDLARLCTARSVVPTECQVALAHSVYDRAHALRPVGIGHTTMIQALIVMCWHKRCVEQAGANIDAAVKKRPSLRLIEGGVA